MELIIRVNFLIFQIQRKIPSISPYLWFSWLLIAKSKIRNFWEFTLPILYQVFSTKLNWYEIQIKISDIPWGKVFTNKLWFPHYVIDYNSAVTSALLAWKHDRNRLKVILVNSNFCVHRLNIGLCCHHTIARIFRLRTRSRFYTSFMSLNPLLNQL